MFCDVEGVAVAPNPPITVSGKCSHFPGSRTTIFPFREMLACRDCNGGRLSKRCCLQLWFQPRTKNCCAKTCSWKNTSLKECKKYILNGPPNSLSLLDGPKSCGRFLVDSIANFLPQWTSTSSPYNVRRVCSCEVLEPSSTTQLRQPQPMQIIWIHTRDCIPNEGSAKSHSDKLGANGVSVQTLNP